MTTYIGVDVSKKSLHIYFPIVDKFLEVTNNLDGFNNLLSAITKYYNNLADLIIVFEHTGSYEQALRDYLRLNNIYFTTVHPNKVRAYARTKGSHAKTDKIDSKLIHIEISSLKDNLPSLNLCLFPFSNWCLIQAWYILQKSSTIQNIVVYLHMLLNLYVGCSIPNIQGLITTSTLFFFPTYP